MPQRLHLQRLALLALWLFASVAHALPPDQARPYAPDVVLKRAAWPTLFALGDQVLQTRPDDVLVVRDARGQLVAQAEVPIKLQRRATVFGRSPVAAGWMALKGRQLTIAMWPAGGTSLIEIPIDLRQIDDTEAATALSGRQVLAWSPWAGGADVLTLHKGQLRYITIGADGSVRSRPLKGTWARATTTAEGRLTVVRLLGEQVRVSGPFLDSGAVSLPGLRRLDAPAWIDGDLSSGRLLWLVTQPQQSGTVMVTSFEDGQMGLTHALPLSQLGLPGDRKLVETFDSWELLGVAASADRWLITVAHHGTRSEDFQALSYDADPNMPPRTSSWLHQLHRITTVLTDTSLRPVVHTTLPIKPVGFAGSQTDPVDLQLSHAVLTDVGFEWHFVAPASGVQSAWWHRVVWEGQAAPLQQSFFQTQLGHMVGGFGPKALLVMQDHTLLFPARASSPQTFRLLQVPAASAEQAP